MERFDKVLTPFKMPHIRSEWHDKTHDRIFSHWSNTKQDLLVIMQENSESCQLNTSKKE